MKKATKTQLKYRKLGHEFAGDTTGKCQLCGLFGDESEVLHSEAMRGQVTEAPDPLLVAPETKAEPSKPDETPAPEKKKRTRKAKDTSAGNTLTGNTLTGNTLTGNTPATEATGSMPAGATPSSVTIRRIDEPRTPLIFSAINKAMALIRPLAKTETHPDGFDFRRIDNVLAELQPILIDCKLFYTPVAIVSSEQTDRPVKLPTGESWVNIFTRITVRYRVYCTLDGSGIDVEAQGEGVSEYQHSTAAAQTMAEKTMLCDLFCIPVYGADDPEAAAPERSSGPDEFPTGSAPQSGELFADAPTETPRKKRSKRTDEPQTVSVAGAALDNAPVVEDKPLPMGLRKILEAGMKAHGVTEAILFAQFKVEKWEDLKAGQMNELNAWVNGYVAEAKEG